MVLPESLEKFIGPIITMCEAQFPRKCNNCKKEFADFRRFIGGTRPLGAPQCSPKIDDPFGLISYVNCECGSTVLLQCADPEVHTRFKQALEAEAKSTGRSSKDLLLDIRAEVRRRLTAEK